MLEDFRLKVFMAVAREGSFTLAARALGITQPAVSQNIAELEKQVGAELFARSRGAVTPTAAGIAFREYAARILYWYEAASGLFGTSGRWTAARPVCIVAEPALAHCVLPSVLSLLLAADSSACFRVDAEPGDDLPDLRIRSAPCKDGMSLAEGSSLAGILPACAVVAAGSPLAQRSGLRPLPSGVRLVLWQPYATLLPADLSARVAVVSAGLDTLPGLVAASPDIVGILPSFPLPDALVKLPTDLPQLQRDIFLSPSAAFSRTPLFALLRQMLADSLSRI